EVNKRDEPSQSYTQLFRSGAIEAAISGIVFQDEKNVRHFNLPTAEALIESAVRRYIPKLAARQVDPPFAVTASAIGVENSIYEVPYSGWKPGRPLNRNTLLFPQVTINTSSLDGDWREPLRALVNPMWNAFGFAKSLVFDKAQ